VRILGGVLAALLLLTGGTARGAPLRCAAPVGMSPLLAELDAGERQAFVNRELSRASRHAVVWTGVFASTFSALTVGGAVLGTTLEEPERVDYFVAAATSFVGVLKFALTPLPVLYRAKPYFGRLAHAFGQHPCEQLAEGERLLVLEAKAERLGKSWIVHAGNFLLNLGGALAIGLHTGRWGNAGLQQLAGFLIGELMIVTQPVVADRALERYRMGALLSPERRIWSLAPAPIWWRDGGGLALAGTF
jgi:hypothetical protein